MNCQIIKPVSAQNNNVPRVHLKLKIILEDIKTMSRNNRQLVPEAKEAIDRFKMEVANEVGVNLKNGYNGDLTSREAGSVGGGMVKKMIRSYEQSLAQK